MRSVLSFAAVICLIVLTSCSSQDTSDLLQLEEQVAELRTQIEDMSTEIQLISTASDEVIADMQVAIDKLNKSISVYDYELENLRKNTDYSEVKNEERYFQSKLRSHEIILASLSEVDIVLGYAQVFEDYVSVDVIEWVSMEDDARIEALGLDIEEDFPNGYYIYNAEVEQDEFKLSSDTTYFLVDEVIPAETSYDNVKNKAEIHHALLVELVIIDDRIIELTERYRP